MKRLFFALLVFLGIQVNALELPAVFSDNMVLQQEQPVRVWGRAEPGASVEVQFAGQAASTTADSEGNWSLSLETMGASFEDREFVVSGGDKKIVFKNVLVGEVWLASGQSNMGFEVRKAVDADIHKLGASDPYLRLNKVAFNPSPEPAFSSCNTWTPDSSESAEYFSAVGYQFACDLRKTLQVPVGVIMSSVGGTPSIAWTRPQAVAENPVLKVKLDEWDAALAHYDEDQAAWEIAYDKWCKERGVARADDDWREFNRHKRQGAPEKPEGPNSTQRPGNLANGMISPVAGYTIRGAIWYQGEADAHWDPQSYDQRLKTMIEDWREWWGADFPFGIVQLPQLGKAKTQPANESWPKIRECQRRVAAADPNTGLVVTVGLGEANDIHPANKIPVGRRLARWALADVYGRIDLRGGPEIESAVREGSSIILIFSQTGSGLRVNDLHELGGFTASDSETEPSEWSTNCYPVEAALRSETEVELTIPEGKNPVRVRYGWQANPADANLTNQERLPASPFEMELP